MHEINFIDRSFNQENTNEYNISIQANQNGLTYCIFNTKTCQYNLFRKHRFDNVVLTEDLIRKINTVLDSDETLSLRFNNVKFLAYTQQSTLIPDIYFDKEKSVDYLRFNHGSEIDSDVFFNIIESLSIYNVFALNNDLVSSITSHFKKVELMNQTTPFLRHTANQSDSLKRKAVFLSLNPVFFDIACFSDNKLKLYNTFQYANENDLLYYTVFVYNQMGFDLENTPLMVSGELSSKLIYLDLFKQYIKEVRYDEALSVPPLTPGLQPLGITRYINLLNLQMCVSSAEYIKAEK